MLFRFCNFNFVREIVKRIKHEKDIDHFRHECPYIIGYCL